MAFKNAINYARFFVQDTATGLGVAGLTVAGNSFTSIKLCQDAVLGDDIKATITLVDCGTGWYGFALTAAQMNKSEIAPVVVPATATYQAYGVTIYTEATGDGYAYLIAAMAELAADAGATPTLIQAIMLLYMKARNAETVTATAKTVKNNAGSVVLTHVLSDDNTTFTKGKLA